MSNRAVEDKRVADTVANGQVQRAYREATLVGLRRASPLALGLFTLFALGSGAIELLYFPQRWLALIVLNAAYLAGGIAHLRVIRRRPQWTVASSLLTIWLVHLSIITYFTVEHGSAELCLVVVGALLTGQVIIFPWSAGSQMIGALAPLVGFVIGLDRGLEAHLPNVYAVFGLLTMVLLTTVGAWRLDRHRFEAFSRARLVETAAQGERQERALVEGLLDLARAMNAAIGEPERLAAELAQHTRRVVGVDWVLVHRWALDSQRFVLTASAGVPPGLTEEFDAVGSSAEWAALLGPLLSGDGTAEVLRADADPLLRPGLLDRWGIRAVRIQAVAREARHVGFITCVQLHSDERFTDLQRRMLSAIAAQAAVALENAGLVEASRTAERVKGEFVATVSHELRTPLNVILGYTDLILDGAFGERPSAEVEALERVRYQSLQLLDLIQGILDLNRLEARGVSLSMRRFPVTELIDSVRQNIPENWQRSGVALNWDGAAPTVLRSDFGKLEIILRNLIHNALKFTEKGAVSVSAEALQGGASVRFVVSDTGAGISPTELPLIFEMFGQGENGPRAGGVGLGLYIVKRLSDALGGRIDVESKEGVGTTFALTLPAEG